MATKRHLDEDGARRLVCNIMQSTPESLARQPFLLHACGVGIVATAARDVLRSLGQLSSLASALSMEANCQVEYSKHAILSFIIYAHGLRGKLALTASRLKTDLCGHFPEAERVRWLLVAGCVMLHDRAIGPLRRTLFDLPAESSWERRHVPAIGQSFGCLAEALRVLTADCLVPAAEGMRGILERIAQDWTNDLSDADTLMRDHALPHDVVGDARFDDLELLAGRHDSVVLKYGQRKVDKLFEERLATLATSLGFSVICDQIAERTVDAICISESAEDRLTFLLEAKSTSGAYALPTKDERALSEYVDRTKKNLRYLPPLRFVLIVGHEASATLGGKLRRLEGHIGIPIRFCTAKTLVELRRRIPGPVPPGLLAETIVNAPPVLPDSFPDELCRIYYATQSALARLVRSLFERPQELRTDRSDPETGNV